MKLKKLTPNLIVNDVDATLNFYCRVLGFVPGVTVPDTPPYVFGSVVSEKGSADGVEIFFNDRRAVAKEDPSLGTRPIGGSLTLFIEVDGIEDVAASVRNSGAHITMPIRDQFYGMREFAFEDPEGWIVTIAEKIK
jgi:uncharacterized glyoxalase superfamily protein PhnB